MSNVTANVAFPAALVTDLFQKTKGHSTLAKLSGSLPIAFSGTDVMTFSMDGEAALVGESAEKPAGSAVVAPVTITPVKFVYQHRVSDEFINCSDEVRLNYLQGFADGFARKIARGLDIAALHGLNPATATSAATISGKSFDTLVTSTVTYAAASVDANIESAVAAIRANDGEVNGIALAPAAAAAMAGIKANGMAVYPEYQFGANPDVFRGMASDVNSTLAFNSSNDRVIVGDFANAFKWGYAKEVPMEVIEYGDPDGQGDLKRTNQVVLRAEAYIGWGILDANSFCRVVEA